LLKTHKSLFGVTAPIRGNLSAAPKFAGFDPDAVLTGLPYQGRPYRITGSSSL
jgi:hypothetical protein